MRALIPCIPICTKDPARETNTNTTFLSEALDVFLETNLMNHKCKLSEEALAFHYALLSSDSIQHFSNQVTTNES